MFADDTKMHVPITDNVTSTDCLQECINLLSAWSSKWQLSFNEAKCHVLTIQNRTQHHMHDYTFNNTILEHTEAEKDLGILVDCTLNFKQHIDNICSKANKVLGMIKHNFTFFSPKVISLLYKSLVRPILEYGACIWSPEAAYLEAQLEQVQHRATKLIPEISHLPYEQRLQCLNIPSLSFRRTREDVIQVYKLLNHLYTIDHTHLLSLSNLPTRNNGLKLKKEYCNTSHRQAFFTQRVVNAWNSLPSAVVLAPTLDSFKNRLEHHWADKMFEERFTL